MPEAKELLDLYYAWRQTTQRGERERIWKRMLAIHADNVFNIGIVSGVPQPIVVHKRLRNVPAEAIYSWDPGAHFGLYRPDQFYYDGPPPRQTAQSQ
jgi:peptide/nickel transport system substrate-binding protein